MIQFVTFILLFASLPAIASEWAKNPDSGSGNAPLQCPNIPATLSGMDVSGHQLGIDWQKLTAKPLITYSFIKATEGIDFTSPAFANDWLTSQQVGVIRGAYHFFLPKDDSITQADFFLKTVGALAATDMPLLVDVEQSQGMAPGVIAQRLRQFLDYLEQKTGRTPVLYTYPKFWHQLGDPAGFDHFPLFISHLNVPCPEIPSPWKDWLFWQDTNTNSFPGVPGPVDHDFFQGSLADMQKFIGAPPAPHYEEVYE